MANYRESRNFEASIIEHIRTELTVAGFNNIEVEKTFARIYDLKVPSICVRVLDTIHNRAQIGGDGTFRQALVAIDIFASSDGQRLDLKDFLISNLKKGMDLFDYTITNGSISSKNANGRLKVLNILDTVINPNIDKNDLDIHDRYRHLLTLTIETGKVEA